MTERAGDASVTAVSRGLVFRLSVTLVIATLMYGALLFYADASAIMRAISQLTSDVLWLGLALGSANYVLRFGRWVYYLRLLSIEVPWIDSLLVFIAGFAMSITPAKVGEVLKSLMLRDAYDIPIVRSAPIVVAERATDVTGLLLLGGFGLLGTPIGIYAAISSTLIVIVIGVLISTRSLAESLIRMLSRVPRLQRFEARILEAYTSLHELLSPWAFIVGTVLSIVSWGVQGFALMVIANAFPRVHLDVGVSMVAYAAPLLAGTLAMIPGGLGLTEASMTGVITRFGGPGATVPVAAAVSLVVRVVTFWLAIALGFAALMIWQLRRSAARKANAF